MTTIQEMARLLADDLVITMIIDKTIIFTLDIHVESVYQSWKTHLPEAYNVSATSQSTSKYGVHVGVTSSKILSLQFVVAGPASEPLMTRPMLPIVRPLLPMVLPPSCCHPWSGRCRRRGSRPASLLLGIPCIFSAEEDENFG